MTLISFWHAAVNCDWVKISGLFRKRCTLRYVAVSTVLDLPIIVAWSLISFACHTDTIIDSRVRVCGGTMQIIAAHSVTILLSRKCSDPWLVWCYVNFFLGHVRLAKYKIATIKRRVSAATSRPLKFKPTEAIGAVVPVALENKHIQCKLRAINLKVSILFIVRAVIIIFSSLELLIIVTVPRSFWLFDVIRPVLISICVLASCCFVTYAFDLSRRDQRDAPMTFPKSFVTERSPVMEASPCNACDCLPVLGHGCVVGSIFSYEYRSMVLSFCIAVL